MKIRDILISKSGLPDNYECVGNEGDHGVYDDKEFTEEEVKFLKDIDITPELFQVIYDKYIDDIIKVIKRNPYMKIYSIMNGQEMSEFNELKIKEDFTGFMSSNNKLNSRNKIVLKTFIELLDTYSLSDLLEENSKVKKELENGVFDLVKNNADALSKVLKNIEYFEGYFKEWKGLKKIFAIKREIEQNGEKTIETSCYLSSKDTNAENLMKYARNHWKIESMHHILDVTYDEDRCKLLTKKAQENINIFRKMGISIHKNALKNKKQTVKSSMFNCLLNDAHLLEILQFCNNR